MGRARHNRGVRVVVLDHTGELGGAELALARLLDHLGADIDVDTVLFADGPLVRRLEQAGHHVDVLPLDPAVASADRHSAGASRLVVLANALRVLPFAVRLGLRLRRLRPDLVVSTSLKADLLGLPAAWIAGRPLVWHVHDRISPDYLPGPVVALLRFLARRVVRRVVVNSEGTAATLPGVPRMVVAYPGFDAGQVGPSPEARAVPEVPVVGIIGRISPTKGQLEFVRAAPRVLERHPEARFRIIGAPLFGEEAYADRVRAEVERLGLGERVEFTGFIADPRAALDGLSVCVHASGQPEPFGQVIVEAMIRGVPVVATRGGGVTEIVHPDPGTEPLGLLVEPDDVAGLADAVLEVLDRPEDARHRATAAWASARERFPIERTAAVVAEFWRAAARH